jgi:hypothetical protein
MSLIPVTAPAVMALAEVDPPAKAKAPAMIMARANSIFLIVLLLLSPRQRGDHPASSGQP